MPGGGDGAETAVPSNGTDRGGGHLTGSSTATCSVQPESGCYWVSVLARFDACHIPLWESVQQCYHTIKSTLSDGDVPFSNSHTWRLGADFAGDAS